jgi:hypothetical protein
VTQSGFIAGALLAGFVLYLAAKGRLSTYAAVLWGPTSASVPNSGGKTAPSESNPLAVLGSATETFATVSSFVGL